MKLTFADAMALLSKKDAEIERLTSVLTLIAPRLCSATCGWKSHGKECEAVRAALSGEPEPFTKVKVDEYKVAE